MIKLKNHPWTQKTIDKSVQLSDKMGSKANAYAAKAGSQAFWPVSGDFPQEMDKAARILRSFTVDDEEPHDSLSKVNRSLSRIPAEVIAKAKGLVIFTSMRFGVAPWGGAGGCGVIVARLPDGSWSAPSSISPNNVSAGLMLGADIYDAILVIRTDEALSTFSTHKVTLGSDIAVVSGPLGIGAALEVGVDKSPVFSYIRSRGAYVGIQAVGQAFVERFDENAAMYSWPGIKAGDILSGKVRTPPEALNLHYALYAAEGRAIPN